METYAQSYGRNKAAAEASALKKPERKGDQWRGTQENLHG